MDGIDKVTGKAIYTDDLTFPGMLHARVKRAMVPSAVVRKIDVSRAKALPGVAAVLTAPDIPGDHNHGIIVQDWPILVGAGEKVRTVGDALALVAAETRDIASRALALIDVEFDPLPVVRGPREALQSSAPAIHPNGNLLKHIEVKKGDVELGFAEADVVLDHTFHTPSYDHAFLEPECSIARPTSEGRMEVYVGSQIPYDDRRQVAAALGAPESQVRVVGQLIGGGFGGKEDIARADTRRLARSGHSEAGEASFRSARKPPGASQTPCNAESASRSVRRGREDSPRVKPSCTGTPEPTLHSGRK